MKDLKYTRSNHFASGIFGLYYLVYICTYTVLRYVWHSPEHVSSNVIPLPNDRITLMVQIVVLLQTEM